MSFEGGGVLKLQFSLQPAGDGEAARLGRRQQAARVGVRADGGLDGRHDEVQGQSEDVERSSWRSRERFPYHVVLRVSGPGTGVSVTIKNWIIEKQLGPEAKIVRRTHSVMIKIRMFFSKCWRNSPACYDRYYNTSIKWMEMSNRCGVQFRYFRDELYVYVERATNTIFHWMYWKMYRCRYSVFNWKKRSKSLKIAQNRLKSLKIAQNLKIAPAAPSSGREHPGGETGHAESDDTRLRGARRRTEDTGGARRRAAGRGGHRRRRQVGAHICPICPISRPVISATLSYLPPCPICHSVLLVMLSYQSPCPICRPVLSVNCPIIHAVLYVTLSYRSPCPVTLSYQSPCPITLSCRSPCPVGHPVLSPCRLFAVRLSSVTSRAPTSGGKAGRRGELVS